MLPLCVVVQRRLGKRSIVVQENMLTAPHTVVLTDHNVVTASDSKIPFSLVKTKL